MILALEEHYRARIELEYGSIIEFKRQLYGMIPFVQKAASYLIDVIEYAINQLVTCIQEFIKAWWNIVGDSLTESISQLGKILSSDAVEISVSISNKYRSTSDFDKHYDRNRVNKPTFCRCRSNC